MQNKADNVSQKPNILPTLLNPRYNTLFMETKKIKLKAPIVGILALLLLTFFGTQDVIAPSHPEYALAYDYNNNGAIDAGDLEFLVGVINKVATCPSGRVCDLTQDGRVDAVDLDAIEYFVNFDYNNDAKLDSSDTAILERVIYFSETCPQNKICDLNQDSTVNYLDGTYLWHLMNFDYNHNQILNEQDVNFLTGVVYSAATCPTTPIQKLCDTNQDGQTNQNDIDYLKGQIEKINKNIVKTQPTCTDSDGGKNIYVAGETKQTRPDGTFLANKDECWGVTNQLLSESYCEGGELKTDPQILCPNGCSSGACLSQTPTCTDTDPTNDIYTKGYATIDGGKTKIYDHCATEQGGLNTTSLTQTYCKNNKIETTFYDCPAGCKEGACITKLSSVCEQLYSKIKNSFGSSACSINSDKYDVYADINNDQVVNILDFSLFSSNHQKSGWCEQQLSKEPITKLCEIKANLVIKIPTTFALEEGQTAIVSNNKNMKITVDDIFVSGPQNSLPYTATTATYYGPHAKITVIQGENTKDYTLIEGNEISIFGVLLTLNKLDETKAVFSIRFKNENICPTLVPPSPDACPNGKWIYQGVDENGCQRPPICKPDNQTTNIEIPSSFFLREGQTAQVTDHKEISGITLLKLNINKPCAGDNCPKSYFRESAQVIIHTQPDCEPNEKPCAVAPVMPPRYTIYEGESIAIYGIELSFLGALPLGHTNAIPGTPIDFQGRFKIEFSGEQTYCPEIYQPLCGLDGKTYTNSCELEASGQQAYCDGTCPCPTNRVDLNLEYDQTTQATLNEKQYIVRVTNVDIGRYDLGPLLGSPTPEDPTAPPSVPTVPPTYADEEYIKQYQWPNQQNTPTGAVVGETSGSAQATTTTMGPETRVKINPGVTNRPYASTVIIRSQNEYFTTKFLTKYQSQTLTLDGRTLKVFIKDISPNAQGKIITRFAIFDLTGEEITPPPPTKPICENGCLSGGVCFNYGIRIEKQGQSLYCGFTGEFTPQKQIGESCQNDFECQTNTCSNGTCYDIQRELRETRGLLDRILDWLRRIF